MSSDESMANLSLHFSEDGRVVARGSERRGARRSDFSRYPVILSRYADILEVKKARRTHFTVHSYQHARFVRVFAPLR